MTLISDLKILYHLAVCPIRGKDHSSRLDSFYGKQAGDYDQFRAKLLKGREELWGQITHTCWGTGTQAEDAQKYERSELTDNLSAIQSKFSQDDLIWADMGGGTGYNLLSLGNNIRKLKKIYIADLSDSLLGMAKERILANNWVNVEPVKADATEWVPPEGKIDIATFSYSLTMMNDWYEAIDQAYQLLKPGGIVGIVDFYVSRQFPKKDHVRHSWATRYFWPTWFSRDNLHLSSDHLPYIERKFQPLYLHETSMRVAYHPFFWWKVPFYIFIGQKPLDAKD